MAALCAGARMSAVRGDMASCSGIATGGGAGVKVAAGPAGCGASATRGGASNATPLRWGRAAGAAGPGVSGAAATGVGAGAGVSLRRNGRAKGGRGGSLTLAGAVAQPVSKSMDDTDPENVAFASIDTSHDEGDYRCVANPPRPSERTRAPQPTRRARPRLSIPHRLPEAVTQ